LIGFSARAHQILWGFLTKTCEKPPKKDKVTKRLLGTLPQTPKTIQKTTGA
jgi:hypothetical protein